MKQVLKMEPIRRAFMLGYAYAMGIRYGLDFWLALDGEFRENDHPRDKDGKFAKNGVSGGKEDISSLLTPEIKGVRGKAAIEAIREAGKGYVKGAFHRNDIGDIDLFWGNNDIGLKHILLRRQEQGVNMGKFLNDLTETIENGKLRVNSGGNFEIWNDGNLAVVYPSFKGNKLTFVCTAYKQRKPSWIKKA